LVRIVTKQGTKGRNDLVSFGGEHGRRVRGIGGREWSRSGEENLEYLSPLREGHFLI
jgi:hypothetical protein